MMNGSLADNSAIIEYLRGAVVAGSSFLLDDFQLGKLGFPAPSLVDRFKQRSQDWSKHAAAGTQLAMIKNAFGSKLSTRSWLAKRGVRLPELYWEGTSIPPSVMHKLPPRFVLKPSNSHSCKGVILFDGGLNLLTREPVSLAELPDIVARLQDLHRLPPQTHWIIEELIADADDRCPVPRDFKVFCAGGHAFLNFVIDRNAPYAMWTNSWNTRDWRRIEDRMNVFLEYGPTHARPGQLETLLETSDALARELGVFVRIDWYVSAQGPVFGEFSPFPTWGRGYTALGERTLSQMWDLFPDASLNDACLPAVNTSSEGA